VTLNLVILVAVASHSQLHVKTDFCFCRVLPGLKIWAELGKKTGYGQLLNQGKLGGKGGLVKTTVRCRRRCWLFCNSKPYHSLCLTVPIGDLSARCIR
jgi:hypothetical protein